MVGVPEEIYSIMPPQVKDKKKGSILTDLESIRLIGRELLGDRIEKAIGSLTCPEQNMDGIVRF